MLRRPSQLMPIASSTAWLRITPASRTRSPGSAEGRPRTGSTGVHDQVRAGLVEPPAGELGQPLVVPRVDCAERRGREAVAAHLLGDCLDLSGREALLVLLGKL